MADLRIPRQYQTALRKLLDLNDESRQQLFDILQKEQPALNYGDLASHVASQINGVQADDIKDIVQTILALYSVRAYRESSVTDFAMAVTEAEELKIPEEKRDYFKDWLIKLLSFESLTITSKAADVSTEHEHTLYEARILTDVRPIFGENALDPPVAVTIVHTLKLIYRYSGDFKEFFVALDSSDVKILRELLDRADAKERSLKAILQEVGMAYLGAEEG